MFTKRTMPMIVLVFAVIFFICLCYHGYINTCFYGCFDSSRIRQNVNNYKQNVVHVLSNTSPSLPPVQVLDVMPFRLWKELQANGSSIDVLLRSMERHQIGETDGVLIHKVKQVAQRATIANLKSSKYSHQNVLNRSQMPAVFPDRGLHTVPRGFTVKASSIPGAGQGVWTLQDVPPCTIIGPYWGKLLSSQQLKEIKQRDYIWELSNRMYRDPANETISNWLRYINCPYYKHEQNLIAGEYDGEIYLRTVHKIPAGTELLCWYGDQYGNRLRLRHEEKRVILKQRT